MRNKLQKDKCFIITLDKINVLQKDKLMFERIIKIVIILLCVDWDNFLI